MTQPPLSEDLAHLLESGLSFALATAGPGLVPNGARAWAVRVDPDRTHVEAFVQSTAAAPLLHDLAENLEIALGVDRPTDNSAYQLKGKFVGSRRVRPSERAELERQVAGFLAELETLRIPEAMTSGWRYWPCVAVRFRVTEVFHQTPGPGAGDPLR